MSESANYLIYAATHDPVVCFLRVKGVRGWYPPPFSTNKFFALLDAFEADFEYIGLACESQHVDPPVHRYGGQIWRMPKSFYEAAGDWEKFQARLAK